MDQSKLARFRDDEMFVPPPGSNLRQCEECSILIGQGYQETEPYLAPDGESIVCSQCYESLLRRARREADRPGPEPRSRAR